MKVLLAIDESAFAAEAVQEIEARLNVPDVLVRVLHVVGTFVPPAAAVVEAKGSLEGVRDEVSERYQKLVDETAARLKQAGIKAEGIVREGSAGKTIVQEAEEWDADLIVVGAHGLSGLESLIMGNVARHVVDHAPCSVEVVRAKTRTENQL
jgi:nucleotide-binding universal stress UspA family protein